MTYNEAVVACENGALDAAARLYALDRAHMTRVRHHDGGRNIVYSCDGGARFLRVSFLSDRKFEDFLAECEFVRYLSLHGARVANVVDSINGALAERLEIGGGALVFCLFEAAPGDQIAEHYYKYIDGRPLSEYFFNCGQTLGAIHRLSKLYSPTRARYDFFDKCTPEYINSLIPDEMADVAHRLVGLLGELRALPRNSGNYGLVHFDFSDGNYMIDYKTGDITVYDFDNTCTAWYLFDLANLWTHGVGWAQFEPDAEKRRAYMDMYFSHVLAGYRSETGISDAELENLPLMINAVLLENIVDEFETARDAGEKPELDGEMAYRTKCLLENVGYEGFFSDFYSCEHPFSLEG